MLNKIMLSKYLRGKILVMIDAANLESSVKDLGWWIDYIKLRDLFNGGNLVEIRNYCVHHGTQNQNNFFTFLKKNGFVLITKSLKIIKQEDIEKGDIRKANFDVEIAVDAMEMANKFDTLVLFSGDSDFDYLVSKIRKKVTAQVAPKVPFAKGIACIHKIRFLRWNLNFRLKLKVFKQMALKAT